MCDTVLDEIICDMFGVAPLTEEQKIVRSLITELVNESVEKASSRKKSVTIQSSKAKKKHFSIFDEIPEELLEKRRSCRQNPMIPSSGDNSNDTGGTQSSFAHKQLLLSYLPETLRSSPTDLINPLKNVKQEEISKPVSNVVKALDIKKSWLTSEQEAAEISEFLTSKETLGHPVDLMRFFMKLLNRKEEEHILPRQLVSQLATIYQTWRQHWGYQLEYEKPGEELTQDCVR